MNDQNTPENLERVGKSAYQNKQYQTAAENFQLAAGGYATSGEKLLAAEMQNNASVAYLQAGNPEEAFEVVIGTETIFREAGDTRRQALALGNIAAALEALGRIEEAIAAYEESSELLKSIGEKEMRASVMQSLSALQLRSGKQLEALATMQAGIDGIEHPSLKERMLKKLLQVPFKLMNRS